MKINNKKVYNKFRDDQFKISERASEILKEIMQHKNIIGTQIRKNLTAECGIIISEPTFYKWLNNPFIMNKYESASLAKAMSIDQVTFDKILSGSYNIEVKSETNIIAN